MMRLVVISGSEPTRREVVAQLTELFGGSVVMDSCTGPEGLAEPIHNALVLVTSHWTYRECKQFIGASCKVVVAERTLNFAHLDKLYSIPEGSNLLIVNDARQTTEEVIELLKTIGFTNYRFVPYHPGCAPVQVPIDYVITPGETSLVPMPYPRVIDIGPRILDIASIIEVVKMLQMEEKDINKKISHISAKYLSKIISLGKEIQGKNKNLNSLNSFLLEIINLVNDGIVVYDAKGVVGLINRIAMKILDLTNESNIIIQSEISNKNLHHFLVHADLENHILHLDSATYLLSKREIGMTGHFLLTIKNMRERINMENRLRSELKKQGYRAKYQFSDIIYGSKVLGDLITKSKKLAESEFNILIYGESGTGKEIFAGAIHNASLRKNGPFFAVNFSSLPDDLIESELFGYEEGAFTGAKKGGKVGLFELANQGTLFLDEIGDTSLKIQSRLLRVLQEREILKVGGTKNIPVDVRIIAATNKNLMEVMKQGRFREDLYYRIKKLYFQIPPLRQRREDILPLFKHFLVQKNGFMIPVAEEVKQLLRDYDWPGNVRELENAVEYILSLSAGDVIETSMLPEDMLGMATVPRAVPDGLVLFLLQNINRFNAEQVLVGRKKLSLLSQDSPFVLSEQQLRKVLGDLAARGLVQMGRGRVGVRLTGPGRAYLEQGNG